MMFMFGSSRTENKTDGRASLHTYPHIIQWGNRFFALSALALFAGPIWFVGWPQTFTLAGLIILGGFSFVVGPILAVICYWLGW